MLRIILPSLRAAHVHGTQKVRQDTNEAWNEERELEYTPTYRVRQQHYEQVVEGSNQTVWIIVVVLVLALVSVAVVRHRQ